MAYRYTTYCVHPTLPSEIIHESNFHLQANNISFLLYKSVVARFKTPFPPVRPAFPEHLPSRNQGGNLNSTPKLRFHAKTILHKDLLCKCQRPVQE